MKRSHFTDSQIIAIIKQAAARASAPELCREHGISSASCYQLHATFGGMNAALISQCQDIAHPSEKSM